MDIFAALCILTLNYFAADAYIRVERAANCPRITDFPGRVKYRRKGTRAVFRCPKKFDRYGSKFSTCQSDGTWSNDPPLCIKTGCVPLDPSQVVNLDMEVVNGALVKFTCLEEYLLIGETMAYCNGKDWSAPLPRCAAPHELTECDFEEDLCGWVQDDNEEQDWIRQMGPTQTGNTGPKHDHTLGDTGNGHYLYFETSNPTMTGHQANLLSPVYTEDLSPMCFDFWYHILGPDENGHVGSLEVFVLDQSQFIDDDDVQPVFVKEGNKGDAWHRGDIFIDRQVEPYQIAIVATRALSYISDIAIDDVRLYNCTQSTTPPPELKTSSTTTTTTTTTATTTDNTTTTIKTTVTSSPTTVITETKTTIKSPTTTTVKTETVTESPTTTSRSTTITESPTKASTATKTVTTEPTSSTAKPAPVSTTEQTKSTTLTTINSPKTPSKTSPNPNTWSSVFTKTTMTTQRSTSPVTNAATRVPTKTTEKTKTSHSKTSATTSKPTIASSFTTTSSTTSTTQATKSPVSSQTTSKSSVSTSYDSSTSTPERKSTTKTSTESQSKPTTFSTETTTSSEKTTTSPIKTDASTRGSTSSTSSSATSTTSSSSFSTSSSTVTTSSHSSSSSSSFSSTSSTTRKTSTGSKTGETKPKTTSSSYNTQTKVSVDSSGSTKTVKPTKSTNDITTKSSIASSTTKENSISVTGSRSKHPENDTLKPLMIGLCVGIVAGLIIIGVIAYVCVRRRKFYTSRYEDELKPITNSASLQSLNNGHYYQDEEYESES